MNSTDPFHVLGLKPGAPHDEVRLAYRKLAMRWHPDRNAHSKAAEERFKHIKSAYEIASDEGAYRTWLETRRAASASRARSAASKTTTEAPTQTPDPVAPIEQSLALSLEEAAHGGHRTIRVDRPVACKQCSGSGRIDHTHSMACPQCQGIGRLRGKSLFSAAKCPACSGQGYVRHVECADCLGRGQSISQALFEVKVPAGLRHGETLRLSRAGGSILLQIAHLPHPFFTLQGNDLYCDVPVDVLTVIAGGEIEVPTLGRPLRVPLPAASLSSEIRLVGKGFPRRHGKAAGDLVLKLQTVFPKNLTPSETDRLRQLATSMTERCPELQDWTRRMKQRAS